VGKNCATTQNLWHGIGAAFRLPHFGRTTMNSTATWRRIVFATTMAATAAGIADYAQAALQFWKTNGTSGTWTTGTPWSNPPTAAGNAVWVSGNTAQFTANTGALTFASTNVTGVTVDPGVIAAITTTGGTWSTSGTVMPVDVGAGGVFDMASQGVSTAAGVGFNKTGSGTLSLIGSAYLGGFTLNDGIVVLRGINALGNGALTINGGTIATNNSNKAITGITGVTVGGNFTMGAVTTNVPSGNATATNTISISAPVNLGGATRTISIGANANGYTFSGAVSSGGLIIDTAGGTGRIILSGPSTFTGGVTVKTGATLSNNLSGDSVGVGLGVTSGPLGTGTLTMDGGRYIPSSGASKIIGNNIFLNNVSTNQFSIGATTLANSSTFAGDITGPGGFHKSGGTLILTGANSYTGVTSVDDGALGLARTQSFYGGNSANWIATNFAVGTTGALVLAVGGAGEFTFDDFETMSHEGTATGGFLDLGSIGIDTTNAGPETIVDFVLNNTNSGANRLGLVKSGLNTLKLTEANLHGGATTLAGGELKLSNQLALQKSPLTTSSLAGTVLFDQAVVANDFTFGGLNGNGNISLMNDNFVPIDLTLDLTIDKDGTSTSYSGILSGTGATLTKIGAGTQRLSGNNTFDGGTTVSGGVLSLGHSAAIGTGTLTLEAGGGLDASADITSSTHNNAHVWKGSFKWVGTEILNLGSGTVTMEDSIQINATGTDSGNNRLEIGGVISGTGFGITKTGPGRIQLTGQSTFDGGVTIDQGAVHLGDQSSTPSGIGPVASGPLGIGPLKMNGTTADATSYARLIGSSGSAANEIGNDIVLTGDDNELNGNGTLTLNGVISGSGSLERTGNGTLKLTNANTFSGNSSAGASGTGTRTLNLSHELALQNSTLVTSLMGGFIEFDGSVASNAFTLGGLSGDRNLLLTNSFAVPITLTIGNNSSDTTHMGNLSGDGSNIIKVGTGKSTLGGMNTYTGTTTINNGTLLVNGTHSGTVGAYMVNSGGTLGGTGDIDAAVSVASGGAVAPGASIESLDVDSLSLASGSLLNFELGAPGVSDLINVTLADGFTANGGTFNFTNAGGMATGSYSLIDYNGVLGGSFANLALGMTQPAGFTYMLVDNAGNTSIDLQVTATTLPGDFNLDGKVDAADYVVWRKNPGGFPPNAYETWRANFGNPPGVGAGLNEGAVPEPAAAVLVILAAVTGWIGRRRSH
jgi:autotransporter-associated beta strand protein